MLVVFVHFHGVVGLPVPVVFLVYLKHGDAAVPHLAPVVGPAAQQASVPGQRQPERVAEGDLFHALQKAYGGLAVTYQRIVRHRGGKSAVFVKAGKVAVQRAPHTEPAVFRHRASSGKPAGSRNDIFRFVGGRGSYPLPGIQPQPALFPAGAEHQQAAVFRKHHARLPARVHAFGAVKQFQGRFTARRQIFVIAREPGFARIGQVQREVRPAGDLHASAQLEPFAGDKVPALPGPVYLNETAELPEPSPEWNGRMIVHGKTVYLGIVDGGISKWMEFSGKVVEPKQYTVVGPELAFNADQSGNGQSDDPALNDPVFPGWDITMRTATEKPLDPHDGYVTFDTENYKSGGRSLKVLFPEHGSEWRARQRIQVQPGKRYRATALVRGEEPRNFYLSVTCSGKSAQVRGIETQDWQTLSVEFNSKSSSCDFIIRGAKTSPGKGAWVDSISLRELVEVGAKPDEDENKLVPVGDELIAMPQAEDGKLKKGWGIAGCAHEVSTADGAFHLHVADNGNLSLTTTVALQPGSYRYELEFAEETSKFRLSAKLPDGKRLSGKAVDALKYQCDFTLDAEGKVQLGLWGGALKPGEGFTLKHVSLRALAEP